MKKIITVILVLLPFLVYAGWKETYDELASGDVTSADAFLVLDASDTTMAATGTQKYFLWSSFVANFLSPTGDGSSLTGLQFDQFTTQTAWRVFYSNGSGDVTELALGGDATYLRSNGATAAPTFDTPVATVDDLDALPGDTVDDDLIDQALVAGMAASASPTSTFLDSDAPGADKEVAKIIGAYIDGADGSENGTLSLYAHQGGTSTEYIQVDGKNTVIDMLKPTVFASTVKIHTAADPDIAVAGQISYDSDGANVTGDASVRASDGTNQWLVARKLKCIHATAIKPQDWADAARDKFVIWENLTGMTFTVVSWRGTSGTDNTTLDIKEMDADGANPATVDAVEIATDGTGLFYASDTTITAAAIPAGDMIYLDFDDTDDPAWVKMSICGWFSADVD